MGPPFAFDILAPGLANSAPAAREAAADAGMNGFPEKPLRRQVLMDFVRGNVVLPPR